jgi:hypothetical protein
VVRFTTHWAGELPCLYPESRSQVTSSWDSLSKFGMICLPTAVWSGSVLMRRQPAFTILLWLLIPKCPDRGVPNQDAVHTEPLFLWTIGQTRIVRCSLELVHLDIVLKPYNAFHDDTTSTIHLHVAMQPHYIKHH